MTSRVDELARANLKPAGADPCTEWDAAVEWRMATYGEDRSQAVDRLLSTHQGSDMWLRCQAWDARQPKTIIQDGVRIRTGNWGNAGSGTMRRIPRKP
jgi:hypothetical protein